MNDLHKYATFSVDLLGKPNRVNSIFSIGRARIFYKGINRNRTIIDGESADQLAMTIAGTPIIGNYNYETRDFEGHGSNQSAFGFVPLNPNIAWVPAKDEQNQDCEYLEVDVVIWDGRFEEAEAILKEHKHLSMELNQETMRGVFERVGEHTYYRITKAEFAGITVLGDDYEPCFKDAQFISAYSEMISAYAQFMTDVQENPKGGKNFMEEITDNVEPEVITEEVVETVVEATEAEVIEAIIEAVETEEIVEVIAEAIEEAAEVAEEETEVETESVETEETAEIVENDEEGCSVCGNNSCECESSSDEEQEEVIEEDNAEDIKSNEQYEALLADYESLNTKYNEALNSLIGYTRKEKLDIISKFSTKIESAELIERLTNEVDTYSLDQIKNELGQAIVEQMSIEDDSNEIEEKEANFSLNINLSDNSANGSAWDLVRRHKESK